MTALLELTISSIDLSLIGIIFLAVGIVCLYRYDKIAVGIICLVVGFILGAIAFNLVSINVEVINQI